MKKALLKDSIKEIKNTYKRFLSIMLMSFLGVGFFAGIRAASPDMKETIDNYFKDNLLKKGFALSSANSINIGRLVPQIVYYFYGYFNLVKKGVIK